MLNQFQRISLFLFFFSINYEMFVPVSSIGLSVSRVTGILYFASILPEIKYFLRTDRIENVLLFPWLFFALLTGVSLLNINELFNGFFNFSIFQNILLFWILVNHARKDYLILEKGMLFFALGCISMSIFFLLGIGVEYEEGRLSMFKENQNALGLNMIIAIITLLLAVLQNNLKLGSIRFAFLLPIPLMIDFVFETGSRTVFLALIIAIIIGSILYKTKYTSAKIIPVFIGAIFLMVIWISLMQFDVLRDRLLSSAEEGDLSSRDVIWKKLIPLIRENPVFGSGDPGYRFFTLQYFGGDKSPHNVILEVICLTGFVGLFVYLLFLYSTFSKSYNAYKTSGLLLPVLLAIPLIGAILSGQVLTRKIGWVIFAYIVGSTAIKFGTLKLKEYSNHE